MRFFRLISYCALLMSLNAWSTSRIDRKALVEQFSPAITAVDPDSAFMVGNGNFAFTADITGLQTFQNQYSPLAPLMTQAQWAWHSFPNPHYYKIEDSLAPVDVHGTKQFYSYFSDWKDAQQPAIKWLRENPHRFSLGRVGLHLIHADGKEATFTDISQTSQRLDMWNGVLISDFKFDHQLVHVETRVHPYLDMLIVTVRSPLLAEGRLGIDLKFPGVSHNLNPNPADWSHPELHQTRVLQQSRRDITLSRQLDGTRYYVEAVANHDVNFETPGPHQVRVMFHGNGSLIIMVNFSKTRDHHELPGFNTATKDVNDYWHHYWKKGGFIDFTGSTDSRANELQRRVLLSQYLMAVNAAGEFPPQEEGLFSNSWNGKFHLEMPLWHAAQFATWGHTDFLERMMPWYLQQLPEAKARARKHGVRGAWWPKMVGPEGRESPSPINPFIMWQQPTPIYLSELIYRSKPAQQTLQRYKELVFETAELLASYLYYDKATDRYVLGPPVMPAQEVYSPLTTFNPTFELEYFRFGLMTAQKWRERLHLPRNEEWDRVLNKLSPLPQRDGVYLPTESNSDFWRQAQSAQCSHEIKEAACLNHDHPSMLAAFGLLPGADVDAETMKRTLALVDQHWDLRQMWGWDFPMMAMTAARLHEPEKAVDYLFADQHNNQFGVAGMTPREHLVDGHYARDAETYFPSNGALLLAVGMMAAGWDDESASNPGFPKNGWVVHAEGLHPLP